MWAIHRVFTAMLLTDSSNRTKLHAYQPKSKGRDSPPPPPFLSLTRRYGLCSVETSESLLQHGSRSPVSLFAAMN